MDKQKQLDELAEKANFCNTKEFRISGNNTLSDYIKGQTNTFAIFGGIEDMNENDWVTDLEVVTFDDPADYSSVKMYHISAKYIGDALKSQSQIDLSQEKPINIGEAVVKVLREYCAKLQEN